MVTNPDMALVGSLGSSDTIAMVTAQATLIYMGTTVALAPLTSTKL